MTHAVLTPLTAPTPSTPSAWYALTEVLVIYPDGTTEVAFGIQVEGTEEEVLRREDDATAWWLAESKECAFSHIRYLNGMTAEFPTCTC
jgi:hypothetical protein